MVDALDTYLKDWHFGRKGNERKGNLHPGIGTGFHYALEGWKWICFSPDPLLHKTKMYPHYIHMLFKDWRCICFWQKFSYFTCHFDTCFFGNIGLQLEEKRKSIWQTIAKQTNKPTTYNIGAKQLLYEQKEQKNSFVPLWCIYIFLWKNMYLAFNPPSGETGSFTMCAQTIS